MIFTLKQARDFVAPFVENGTCNVTTLNQRINEASRRLFPKTDNRERQYRRVRLTVRNSEFPLPRECENVSAVDINGTPTHIFDLSYEFIHAGVGDLSDVDASTGRYLQDLGFAPFAYTPPANTQFVAFSQYQEDADLSVTLRGMDEHNAEIRDGYNAGELLKINRWQNGVEGQVDAHTMVPTTNHFNTITQVYKPVTKGYVTLFAVDPATFSMWAVAKYHPDDTLPTLRRYKLLFKGLPDYATKVLALCRLRGDLLLTRDDDIVPCDSLDAIKAMVIAIGSENVKNVQEAQAYEGTAKRLLEEQHSQSKSAARPPFVMDVDSHLSLSSRLDARRIR